MVDGRVKWIVDGYTTTNAYPYSDLQPLEDATADSLTGTTGGAVVAAQGEVNYIRNSVKATSTPTTAGSTCTPGTRTTRCSRRG